MKCDMEIFACFCMPGRKTPSADRSQIEPGDPLDDAKGIRTSSERTYSLHAQVHGSDRRVA